MRTLYHPDTKAPLQVEEDQVKAFITAGYTKTVKAAEEVKVPQKSTAPQGGNKHAPQGGNKPTAPETTAPAVPETTAPAVPETTAPAAQA